MYTILNFLHDYNHPSSTLTYALPDLLLMQKIYLLHLHHHVTEMTLHYHPMNQRLENVPSHPAIQRYTRL